MSVDGEEHRLLRGRKGPYLDAPGLIRRGEPLSRREVIKHMANEMGGVHLEKNTASIMRDLLREAESKLFIEAKNGTLRSFYIEVLAIGQAVGRSEDFQKLAADIREKKRQQKTIIERLLRRKAQKSVGPPIRPHRVPLVPEPPHEL